LADALERACRTYTDKDVWEKLIRTGMQQDWSWARSAQEYCHLYERTLTRAVQTA